MDKAKSQQFMQKVVGDAGTAMAAALVHVGVRVGLFKAMAGAGALSAAELADNTGIGVRNVAEWLAAMASAGYVEYDPLGERFTLPDEHALFFAQPQSEYFLGGLFDGLPGLMAMAPRLAAAFERGGGVSFAEFGAGMPLALEHWPQHLRGIASGILQGGYSAGFLLSSLVYQLGYPLIRHEPEWAWRVMLWSGVIPALVVFAVMWTVPESPIWLEQQRKLAAEVRALPHRPAAGRRHRPARGHGLLHRDGRCAVRGAALAGPRDTRPDARLAKRSPTAPFRPSSSRVRSSRRRLP